MISIKWILFLLVITSLPIQSAFAVSNVQHYVDGNKVTITYKGTPPFWINIRGDAKIGQAGGYLWAKTYLNSFTDDMSFAINPSKKFYYGVKDKGWGEIRNFETGVLPNLVCKELISNHNKLKADRINLVFVLIDFPDKDYVINWVKGNLGFDNGTQIFHIAIKRIDGFM